MKKKTKRGTYKDSKRIQAEKLQKEAGRVVEEEIRDLTNISKYDKVKTMKKYRISARSVGYLEQTIEAKNEDEAYDKLQELLEDGALPEINGWIEGKEVEEIK